MKYSVLLPTRNGGPFLRNCILSVLDQRYDDVELVISDNANTDDTAEIIRHFSGDPRVKAVRLTEPVSVTENWNTALHLASGDYLLMLGDDDYLLPGYFRWADALLARHKNPDCVVHDAYSYVAPGSIAGDETSYYNEHHFRFGGALTAEMVMSPELRKSIVKDMFRWTMRIPLNMQTTLVSRRASSLVRGGLFQPPFPDHYALNALLLAADSWVFSPARPLVVGISPKSFGHYVYSNHQDHGLAYLGIDTSFPGQISGSPLINGMHVWLDMLKRTYERELEGVEIDRGGYVRRQVFAWGMQWKVSGLEVDALLRKFGQLAPRDWLALAASVSDGTSWRRLLRLGATVGKSDAELQLGGLQPLVGIQTIREFGQWIARGGDRL